MKDLISKIIWKINRIATTRMVDLFLWIILCGAISSMIITYLIKQHILNNFLYEVLILIFIYYSGYKLILD